ncbi:endonuclease/exonuclease/phosphatase family protein [Bythopirellula polymerisocia]|nr:endonuclease/exonuclease/phosphatase family protein [Bythopirellula polymerisocia]
MSMALNFTRWGALACVLWLQTQVPTWGNTGTFIDRQQATDLRVVTYNVLWDTIFPDRDATQAAKFARVVNALDPDLLNLQEIGDPFCGCTPKNASDVLNLMNSIAPLPGSSWNVFMGGDNVIVSKYPLSLKRTNTYPVGDKSQAIALVDLPDDQFPTDFYLINNHYKCCGGNGSEEDVRRQKQSDAIVNWLQDARTPGGFVELAPGTPFAVLGDLNTVGGPGPLNTLITGNIFNETTYGRDSPPDWDGSFLTDSQPVHNATGTTDYTWRSGNSRSLLDYVIYSDSALDVGNKFVLNTVSMTSADRTATGLQQRDVTIGNSTTYFDHLPVVVDFRIFEFAPSDFNFSRSADGADLATWQAGYHVLSGATRTTGDADGDGDVDGRDFLIWQQQAGISGPPLSPVPEPGSWVMLIVGEAFIANCRRVRYQ